MEQTLKVGHVHQDCSIHMGSISKGTLKKGVRRHRLLAVYLLILLVVQLSATLAQWGERSLSERTVQVLFPVRPDKTYSVLLTRMSI